MASSSLLSSQALPPGHPVSNQPKPSEASPATKVHGSWLMQINEQIPDPASLADFPWTECSTIIVDIVPRTVTPDPSQTSIIDCSGGDTVLNAITKRVEQVSAILKSNIEESITDGTMAVQVRFGENLARILSLFHWIEPESIHNIAASTTGTRTLTPPFILPKVGLCWSDGELHHFRTDESKEEMWRACQQALQTAYKTGMVGELFDGAQGIWSCLGRPSAQYCYVIKDLGNVRPGTNSVLYMNSNEAKLSDDVVWPNYRDTPDRDDFLYMLPARPKLNSNGHGH